MLESQKNILRGVALGLLGFLTGALWISSYSGTDGWRGAWRNLLAITANGKGNSQIAAASCQPEQKTEAEQIFFISCGGIY